MDARQKFGGRVQFWGVVPDIELKLFGDTHERTFCVTVRFWLWAEDIPMSGIRQAIATGWSVFLKNLGGAFAF